MDKMILHVGFSGVFFKMIQFQGRCNKSNQSSWELHHCSWPYLGNEYMGFTTPYCAVYLKFSIITVLISNLKKKKSKGRKHFL